jgi:hypothetical protein
LGRALLQECRSPEVERAAEELRRDGYSSWRLSPEVAKALIGAFQKTVAERGSGQVGTVERSTGKAFFQESLTEQDLRRHAEFALVALDEAVLTSVGLSMGLVPHLEDIEVIVSKPSNGELSASQLWHRDVNDKAIVKLFVYLEGVGAANGPFSFIPAQASGKVPPAAHHYLEDTYVEGLVPRDGWRSIEGQAGTAFLIDTGRCLHFGSRCTKPRVAYIATYSSGLKFMRHARRWRSILGDRADSLSPLQRAVCGI